MADLKEPGRAGLIARGALVAAVFLAVLVGGGWLLYRSVQLLSRSFRFGPVPTAPAPSAPPPSAPAPSASPPSGAPAPHP